MKATAIFAALPSEATESEEDTVWAAYKMLFYREALELNEKQLFLFVSLQIES